jgi:hypothetical protein
LFVQQKGSQSFVSGLEAEVLTWRIAQTSTLPSDLGCTRCTQAETNGTAYNDITVGSNKCTESGCLCHTGFEAEPGWDASTGLGTPNLGRMLAALDVIDERREAKIRQQQQ